MPRISFLCGHIVGLLEVGEDKDLSCSLCGNDSIHNTLCCRRTIWHGFLISRTALTWRTSEQEGIALCNNPVAFPTTASSNKLH